VIAARALDGVCRFVHKELVETNGKREEATMKAQRAGTNRLIEARLREYAQAIKAGASSKEAFEIARKITKRKLRAGR
jgi:hypothetical protein